MKLSRFMRLTAWIAIVVSMCWVALWGVAVSSPSVLVNRQGFAEFVVAAGAVTMGLVLCAKGPWRLVAGLPCLFYGWCFAAGWRKESPGFEQGNGGPWFANVPWMLLLFMALFGLSCAALMRGVSSGKREGAGAAGS